MDDKDIIALFWTRAEEAITQTAKKYENYCRTIIGRILPSPEDVEECLNDTYLGAWNAMPPQRPTAAPFGTDRPERGSGPVRLQPGQKAQCRL